MSFIIWFLITLADLGGKIQGKDFGQVFYMTVVRMNEITGSLIGYALISIFITVLLVIAWLSVKGDSVVFGCLTILVGSISVILSFVGFLAIIAWAISGGFMTTYSPAGGVLRGEFYLFAFLIFLEILGWLGLRRHRQTIYYKIRR